MLYLIYLLIVYLDIYTYSQVLRIRTFSSLQVSKVDFGKCLSKEKKEEALTIYRKRELSGCKNNIPTQLLNVKLQVIGV